MSVAFLSQFLSLISTVDKAIGSFHVESYYEVRMGWASVLRVRLIHFPLSHVCRTLFLMCPYVEWLGINEQRL